jgi:hypothetical protein
LIALTLEILQVIPTYNLADLKWVEHNQITNVEYEIVQAVKAHIPVPRK